MTSPEISSSSASRIGVVARDVLRDCHAQIAANLVVVAGSTEPEGPHQLRVGLRRLRTAFAVFEDSLGAHLFAPRSGRRSPPRTPSASSSTSAP